MSTVTVRPGDSLWAIAQENKTSVQALQAANPRLQNSTLIQVGETLNLPVDQFERAAPMRSSLTQAQFLQDFRGKEVSLERLSRDARVSASVERALSRADRNGDGVIQGESELRRAFGELDHFDRNGKSESIALTKGGRTLALGHVVSAMASALTVPSSGGSTRETPDLDSIARGAVLEKGDRGASVEKLQSRLAQLGFDHPRDGQFDDSMVSVVKAFQAAYQVETTGQFGPTTLAALKRAEQGPRANAEALERFVLAGGELSVGERGAAVVDLQRLLNRRGSGLSEDGIFGPGTSRALKQFQASRNIETNGRVGQTTFESLLRSPVVSGITGQQLRQIVPNLGGSRAEALSGFLNLAMAEAEISTPQRQAMFLAQLAHESGGFRYSEELASGAAYEWRRDLGNIYAGDGRRYKGRGFIQLTGRANYRAAGEALGVDLIGNPWLAATDLYAGRVAAWYWDSRNINAAADRGDFMGVTRLINGGTNGYWDRLSYYNRAQEVLT